MNVAFIGLGAMGGFMARNVLTAGFPLTVFNRTRAKEEPLAEAGASRAASPALAAAGADVVVVCLSDTPDVEAVLLGPEGVMHGAAAGTVVVDCSTICPDATRRMAACLAEKGVGLVDAPVSGGTEGARKGTLAIMAGGSEKDFQKVQPVLAAMGSSVTHLGPSGSGQLAKAINQVILAGTYLGVAEGMTLGLKAGLDMAKVVQAIRGGAAGSWVLDNRSGNMIGNEYPLGFRVRLHLKDLGIALSAARGLEVTLPVTALAAQFENGLLASGDGDDDVSALARVIRRMSGLD
jgi:3-hydroxyisobutyrate dehydrogenase